MNKRLLLFVALAAALMAANILLLNVFAPPPQPKPQNGNEEGGAGGAAIAAQDDDRVAPLEDPLPPPVLAAPPRPAKETLFALGSAAENSPYSLLTIFTTKGAALHTAELNERRFRDLDDRYLKRGHFGNLALSERAGAAVVGVVGPGTPAAAAGLQAGDEIVSVAKGGQATPVTGPADWAGFISRCRVGQQITLAVRRGGATLQLAGTLGESPLELIQPESELDRVRGAGGLLEPPIEPESRDPLSLLLTLAQIDGTALGTDPGATFKDSDEGVQVVSVAAGGAAEAAGLRPGDVISHLDSTEIGDLKQLNDLLRDDVPPGAVLRVRFKRQGVEQRPVVLRLPTEIPGLDLHTANWDTDGPRKVKRNVMAKGGKQVQEVVEDDQIEFRFPLEQYNLTFVKRYTLAANEKDQRNYHVRLDLEIHHHAGPKRTLAYQLSGPNGLPLEGWWYTSKVSRDWGGVGIRDVAYYNPAKGPMLVGCTYVANIETRHEAVSDRKEGGEPDPLRYVAVDSRYFAAALIPIKPEGRENEPWFSNMRPVPLGIVPDDAKLRKVSNTSFRLTSQAVTLGPDNNQLAHSFTLFLGPKEKALLERPEYQLGDLIYYGWEIWGFFARLLRWLLVFFYGWVGNYGIAVVMLTLVVRACLFPISYKQTKNAQKMQELQPEIRRINEKFKGNYEARAKATKELFEKHKYHPLSGCLPVFLQLPVFIGLYRSLMVNVDLRQQALVPGWWWSGNLAAPDMLWDWSRIVPDLLSSEIGWLGPYFNVLPLFTITLFIIQQKMFMPPPTDEQSAMQQKLMKWMMIFFGVMFFCVPAGLCLYFIVSSLFSIGEKKLLNRVLGYKPAAAAAATAAPDDDLAARRERRAAAAARADREERRKPKHKDRR
jgi:YidC/Oxa1 family membrane protein insertase